MDVMKRDFSGKETNFKTRGEYITSSQAITYSLWNEGYIPFKVVQSYCYFSATQLRGVDVTRLEAYMNPPV
jgi:hypothetical protein